MRPDWSVVLVGPEYIEQEEDRESNVVEWLLKLKKLQNVYLIGYQPKKNLPEWIAQFDVCIVPYKISYKLVRYCNPMKLYEYLACGKPVVATNILALREIDQLGIKIASSANEFIKHIEYFLDNWNVQKACAVKSMITKHNWEQRVSWIEQEIIKRNNYLLSV